MFMKKNNLEDILKSSGLETIVICYQHSDNCGCHEDYRKAAQFRRKMSNNLDEILSLTKEISFQDSEDIDITVTEYGEKLSETDDIEFLWVARNTSTTVKNASSNIKNFNDQNIANNINQNGPVRLGDEVFVFNKSQSWKVHDLKKFIQWVVEKSKDNDDLVDSLLAIMGQTFVPKLKGLDAFSNSRDINPEMIRDTFLYKEWREKSELKAINTNNTSAPKWAKELGHKERKK